MRIFGRVVAAGPVILDADGEFGLPTRALAGKYGAFLTYDAPPVGMHSNGCPKHGSAGVP